MQSYFDACSDSLKPCIFYLLVFPANHKRIRRKRLLRRWIAEGYSRDTSDGGTAEENGKKLFNELVDSSIIQRPKTPRISGTTSIKLDETMYQVNGFFHEYIISRPMEDNLVFSLEGRCSLNSLRTGQHLTIRSCWNRDRIVFESIDFTRLRSLTVFGKWMPFFISCDNNMRLLRVLDLEDTDSGLADDDLEHIGKLLPRLKFLSLRGCKYITRLPDSFGDLRQLQTLDVKHTKIVSLPHTVIRLVKLQYVRAGPISDEGDDTCLAATKDGDSTIAYQQTAPDGGGTRKPCGVDGDDTSQLPATTDGDGAASRSQPAATTTANDGTSQPAAADSNDTSTSQPAENVDRTSTVLAPRWSRASDLVSYSCNWLSKKKKKKKKTNDAGVKVPAGIWNLMALHTLGIVEVSGAGGKAILEEMKKLMQLRKLGVSGINRNNWQDLCSVISGLDLLESLSVHLDKEEDAASFFSSSEVMFSKLPKTLEILKLYTGDGRGIVQVPTVLIKQLGSLNNLRKVNFEVTFSTQEDIDSLMKMQNLAAFHLIRVKPIQDGELRYVREEVDMDLERFNARVLNIDCGRYKLAIDFGYYIAANVEVLVVHCSTTESSLELSGLMYLMGLKEVWLKGSYSEAVKQHLQQKVAEHGWRKLVLKLEEQPRPS